MRPRAVTGEQILEAADRVARRDGIDGLTIRNLCAELGVTAPAVYRHFSTKDLIVDEVVDRIIARTELPGPETGDWAERLKVCFVSVHDEVAPYGGLAARMGQEMPTGPAADRNGAYLDTLLCEAGIGESDAARIIFATFVYVWGHLLAVSALLSTRDPRYDPAGSRQQFLWGLDHLVDSFRREFGTSGSARRSGRAGPKSASRSRLAPKRSVRTRATG